MPTRTENSDDWNVVRRNPKRRSAKAEYFAARTLVDDEDEAKYSDEQQQDEESSSSSSEEPQQRRAAAQRGARAKSLNKRAKLADAPRRTSARANKFTRSMAEPSSIQDLIIQVDKKRRVVASSSADEDDPESEKKPRSRVSGKGDSLGAAVTTSPSSPYKDLARQHAKMRMSIKSDTKHDSNEDSEESSEEGRSEGDNEDEDDGEPLKIQKIIASRSETRAKWREICQSMNTSEIECGSRWFQASEPSEEDDKVFEERLLVKWKDLSFLHCSWEMQGDLENQIEGARTNLNNFFRKSDNGLLYSADERCDGDYFDPAFVQVDRILEVHMPGDGEFPPLTAQNEHSVKPSDFRIVMDRSDPEFEDGTGRQFLIKWENMPYSEATYEFERDLIINEIDYKGHLIGFLQRSEKPSKGETRERSRKGENMSRKLYKIFGERSNMMEAEREKAVEQYKLDLQNHEYKNGGQLRDYQAEGVAWIMANYVNSRSVILADEMGLGKTLQTASAVQIIANELHRTGPVLIIAPLSTVPHWKREFQNWTDLNVIIYHGSAEDRQIIREHEFVYECDRPDGGVAFNQTYLKKCASRKQASGESPWMAQVVITTPEMVVCSDAAELAAVQWEVGIVDEAHRLKNNNSKLTMKLKDGSFHFNYKILLTGTPIQNDVQEFWTLLNFIDPDRFDDMDEFMEKYGDLKTKERIDELHEEIRPYILRRLKEDVEKSVPPKEETLIEVELTVAQKQYYRALYEKNVAFLRKNKKALDGPSLSNLAMQLRKCCNHLFLLNGVEDEYRAERAKAGESLSEGDLLVKASGKLVLLDKLLPRLRQEGHRVLLFSQFKIMLDILEDFLRERDMTFERIDGSITGNRRQQAIDRFQAPAVEGHIAPFVMMLSTRAGGVGINLTAADTVIIVDSDFNPQNDLQAQARCHRIGQTKSVKVYRLLARKSYEMQMFHMSSLKMGLDQVVLKGFETGSSSEGALSKAEVEKLLRHGAYDIFNEEKAGTAEAESNDFVQQDIDSILQRRTRTVVETGTGSESNAAGGTFSKASFKVAKSPDGSGKKGMDDEVDIEDPDFWRKMLGDAILTQAANESKKPRRRTHANYAENAYMKTLDSSVEVDDSFSGDAEEDDSEDEDEDFTERARWGGDAGKKEWAKDDVDVIVKSLQTFGYCESSIVPADLRRKYSEEEVKRMRFSICFLILLEAVDEIASVYEKRVLQQAAEFNNQGVDGGVLASAANGGIDKMEYVRKEFRKLWSQNASWVARALGDAVDFAKSHEPRDRDLIEKALRPEKWKAANEKGNAAAIFAKAWQSLKNRGWKAEVQTAGSHMGKTKYEYQGKQYWSHESVLKAAVELHPDLAPMCESLLASQALTRRQSLESKTLERNDDLAINVEQTDASRLRKFLERYAPMQVLADRNRPSRARFSRRILTTCTLMDTARSLVRNADATSGDATAIERLASALAVDRRASLPHPLWTARHDAILMHAITKHGWIDHESRLRAIAEDPLIKWGAPFELTGDSQNVVQEDVKSVAVVAHRAASTLNQHHEMLEEFKGFNAKPLIRAYSLMRQKCDDDSLAFNPERPSHGHSGWVVDETEIRASVGVQLDKQDTEPADLPTPKELQKRAKTLLTRTYADTQLPTSGATEAAPTHGFAVLNQGNRCNALLGEILRGLLKAPTQSKFNRKLCQIAYQEASERARETQDEKVDQAVQEMTRIADHIKLVERNLTKSARQYKNVLRVILGEDPLQGRGADEGALFPVEKVMSVFPVTLAKKASKSRSRLKVGQARATGDLAIDAATRKLLNRGQIDNNAIADDADNLHLTEIEVLILSVACSMGLPCWKEDWGAVMPVSQTQSRKNPYTLTWASFGRAAAELGQEALATGKANVNKTEGEISRVTNLENPTTKDSYVQKLFKLENQHERKKRAAEQALEYSLEPETLAKKTIMMMSKIQRFATEKLKRSKGWDSSTGERLISWLKADLSRWAASLDLLDNGGNPLGFTAVDFIDDLPEKERESIEIAAIMDRKEGRDVLSQAALMNRLRSVFITACETNTKPMKVELAAEKAMQSKWDGQPDWWLHGGTKHDQLLLERLLHSGFSGVIHNSKAYGFGPVVGAGVSFASAGMSAAIIQTRATRLAIELDSLDTNDSDRVARECLSHRATDHAPSKGPSEVDPTVDPIDHDHGFVRQPVKSPCKDGAKNGAKRKADPKASVVDLTEESPEKKHRPK